MQAKKVNSIYVVISIMTMISTIWLSYQFWRLLWQPLADNGAVDLMHRYTEVTSFVRGVPVYWELSDAVYPPASYLMLWPLIGWLPEVAVRPYWALTTVACLALLVAQIWLIIQPKRLVQKVFLGLLPLSLYATGAAIGNGQIVIHLLPCLLGSFIVLKADCCSPKADQKKRGWKTTCLASLLMLLALVKPNVTAPFFWILLFKAPSAATLTGVSYTLLTVFSAIFQPEFDGPIALFKSWLTMGMAGVYYGATPYVEYEGGGSISTTVNAHSILGFLNFGGLDFVQFSGWNQLASLTALTLLGIWAYRNKAQDIWTLVSVAAIVSKYWTYHGWYDDLVLIIPMLALFKLSAWDRQALDYSQLLVARSLFVAMLLIMLAPGGAHLLPQPWSSVYLVVQTLTILSVLSFLTAQRRVSGTIREDQIKDEAG